MMPSSLSAQLPKVLVLGGGGREHALLVALSKSPQQPQLFVAPGNAGCHTVASGVDLNPSDAAAVCTFAKAHEIDFVVVGPEAPLVAGVVDALEAIGIPAFGPSQAAAQLEASKVFAKRVMETAGVPTAGYAYCTSQVEALEALARFRVPYVIKEDGLAAGKGVTVTRDLKEAEAAISRAFDKNMHVVIEEFLAGEELSVLAVCDGERALPLISAQDFKRVGEGNTGANTGGMGAYAPVPFVDAALYQQIQTRILEPMMRAMREADAPFRGILYAGLMIDAEKQARVVEFNVRFGDPETQVVLPLLEDRIDLLALLMDSARGDLSPWVGDKRLSRPEASAVTIVMAASGYPGDYPKGLTIRLPDALPKEAFIYHAGTTLNEAGDLRSTGGRVLNVTATGETIGAARENAYAALSSIDFPGSYYRRDIAK